MIGNFGMGTKLEVFYNENIDDNSSPFGNSKYSENTKSIMDKETLDLVNEAYSEAKQLLRNNWDKVLYLSELLKNNTVLNSVDLPNIFINITSDVSNETLIF
jgi:ATP-dependent Zn protease